MVIVLDDSDVEQMLLNKQKGFDPCQILKEKIQEFRLKIYGRWPSLRTVYLLIPAV